MKIGEIVDHRTVSYGPYLVLFAENSPKLYVFGTFYFPYRTAGVKRFLNHVLNNSI